MWLLWRSCPAHVVSLENLPCSWGFFGEVALLLGLLWRSCPAVGASLEQLPRCWGFFGEFALLLGLLWRSCSAGDTASVMWCVCSTNMAIADAGKLGEAIFKHSGNLEAALQEYQEDRIPQTTKEVRSNPMTPIGPLLHIGFCPSLTRRSPCLFWLVFCLYSIPPTLPPSPATPCLSSFLLPCVINLCLKGTILERMLPDMLYRFFLACTLLDLYWQVYTMHVCMWHAHGTQGQRPPSVHYVGSPQACCTQSTNCKGAGQHHAGLQQHRAR